MNEFKLPKIFNWQLWHNKIADMCSEQPLRTGIYDLWPFPITPTMVPTCTKVIDTPAFPTSFPYNLEGYKISGMYELQASGSNFFIEYLGTVETVNGSTLNVFPFKTSGTVTSYPNWPGPVPIVSAFANGASVEDDNGDLVPAELMSIAVDQYSPNGMDVYIIGSANTAVSPLYGQAAFEYEFLSIEGQQLKFTIY